MARSDAELERGAEAVNYELSAMVDCYLRFLTAEHDIDAIAQNAYLEAMLVHARCLIEFIAKPTEKGDPRNTDNIHRHDYLDGWEVSDAAESDRVRSCKLFGEISKHLSHLSWQRARTGASSPPWEYELPNLVVKLFKEFAAEVRTRYGAKPWTVFFEAGVQYAEEKLSTAAPRATGEGATTSGAHMVPTFVQFQEFQAQPRDRQRRGCWPRLFRRR